MSIFLQFFFFLNFIFQDLLVPLNIFGFVVFAFNTSPTQAVSVVAFQQSSGLV